MGCSSKITNIHQGRCVNDAAPQFFLACISLTRRGLALGGHSNTGYSVINESLVIDLSQLKSIQINGATVQVETGCLWGYGALVFEQSYSTFFNFTQYSDLYEALVPRGLLVAGGAESSVGVAGLTLGGGYSIFSPKFGLALDQVLQFEMVDAHGELVVADQESNSDLFWALRGAGHGSFGIVTKITFKTSKLEYPKFCTSNN